MKDERDHIHLREIPSLFLLGLRNSAYRAGVSAREILKLGKCRWYWRLRLALAVGQLTPGLPPARRYPSPEVTLATAPLMDDLVYGESPILTSWQICQTLQLSPEDRIVDLGAGIGLPLFVANLGFGARGMGWEIVPHRLKRAQMLQARLHLQGITFEDRDFLENPLPEATVYWLNPTGLHMDSWRRLRAKFADCPGGTRAVSLTLKLPASEWRLTEEMELPFSWGRTPVYFQERL